MARLLTFVIVTGMYNFVQKVRGGGETQPSSLPYPPLVPTPMRVEILYSTYSTAICTIIHTATTIITSVTTLIVKILLTSVDWQYI